MAFKEINIVGSPYELGYQHGQQARELIRLCFDQCCRFDSADDRREKERLAALIESNVATHMPQAAEEMKGIADGSGMRYEEIQLLNFWNELWGPAWYGETSASAPFGALSTGCTAIGMVTSDGVPLLGKTVDDREEIANPELFVRQRVQPDQGYDFVQYACPGTGILGASVGVNEKGLVWGTTSLLPNESNWEGIPAFILARHLLQHCATVREALTTAHQFSTINFGLLIMFADPSGDIAVLERSTRQAERWLDRAKGERVIFATNHTITKEMEDILGGSEELLENSRQRLANLVRQSESLSLSMEGLRKLLRDHSQPGAICQHGPYLHTLVSEIASPSQRTVWVTEGPPCQNEFVPVSL
jgi:isopenicillin-N N-acyltransferase-like protein